MTTLPDTTRTLVAGGWFTEHTTSLPVYRPCDGSLLCQVPRQGAAAVDVAVTAAGDALPSWSQTAPETRATHLEQLADLIQEDAENLADLISDDVGTPVRLARAVQVDLPIQVLRSTAAALREMTTRRWVDHSQVVDVPVGVVAAVTPWNYPLHQSVAKLAGALAAGCTVVHKPSEIAPLALLRLGELLMRSDLPPGVYNQLSGLGTEVGELLVRHPGINKISFTGSTTVGRRIGAWAGENLRRVSLELGGKSASVVLPGADLGTAVRGTVNNAFLNSGQTCTAWTRLLVPREQLDEAVELAAARAQAVEPRLGPLVSAQQRDAVQEHLRRALADGARAAAGGLGSPPGREEGYFVRATVLTDVRPESAIAQEEVFGPVLCVLGYRDRAEATAIANGTQYGLTAAVWGPSEAAAADFAVSLQAGQVDLNGAPFNPAAPFGGRKASGVGRELGQYGIRDHLETVSIQHPLEQISR